LYDIMFFLKRFVTNPERIGSLVPSSRFLCKLMMKRVPWSRARVIVELGPGTGVFTSSILKKKKPDTRFFVVERDPQFQEMLRERFPSLVIKEEAIHLPYYLDEMNLNQADVVISGLPFAIFPPELRTELLHSIYDSIAPGGLFITFQYSLQLKQELIDLFGDTEIEFTPFNVPPAFVYICTKPKSQVE